MNSPDALADLAELHDELRAVARDLLSGGTGDILDWGQLARAGWLGLEVAEELGGTGASFAEVAVILQEMGRAAAASPYLGTVVLGVGALNSVTGEVAEDHLQRVATGELRVAVALANGDDPTVPFRLDAVGGAVRLHGEASFIPDLMAADRLLLLALDPTETPVLAMVEAQSAGIAVHPQPVLDLTRRFGSVTASGARIADDAILRFKGDPDAAVRRLRDRGAVAVACDSLGAAEAMLDATVAYAGVRKQFGRAIGSFQAVKHACADMLVEVTVGRELLGAAVCAIASAPDEPDEPDEPDPAVPMAKSHLSEAAVAIVGKAMQLHGGYGYTWESGVHVFLKRVLLNRSLFGSPAVHRREIASRYS